MKGVESVDDALHRRADPDAPRERAHVGRCRDGKVRTKSQQLCELQIAACTQPLREADLVIQPLSEPWTTRRLHLCARDFSTLTPHAQALAQQLMTLTERV